MPRSEREPRRSAVTTLACVCGLAVTSLAAGAQPHGAAVPLALPDVTAHPPLPQDFPLPTGQRDEPPADVATSSIGARLNRISQHSSSEAQASPGIALDDGTIPQQVLAAYRRAADVLSRRDPSCRLHWSVLAGIGRIESGHARGSALFSDGRTASPILGPRLDGSLAGTATIRDSTGGQFDGDAVWERAVGPMQFLPSTWLQYGQDGNGDGARDPHNVYDAALSSAVYLCAGARDLAESSQLNQALFSYNPSMDYVRAVLAWADHYAGLGPQPGARRTVTHTLAISRGADGAGGRKPDDEPATHKEPPKPVPPTTSPKSPDQGSDADDEEHEEHTGNDTSKPETDHDAESTEDTEDTAESPAAPNDDEDGQGHEGADEPDSPDTTEPSEPSEPDEPAEPTEPTEPTEPSDPGDADDPTCEQPDGTEDAGDAEDTGAEDGAEDTDGSDRDNQADGTADETGTDGADTDDDSGDSDEAEVPEGDTTDDAPQDDGGDESDGTCEQPDDGDENGENGDRADDADGTDENDGESGTAPTTSTKPEDD